jgi:hypothetical protein
LCAFRCPPVSIRIDQVSTPHQGQSDGHISAGFTYEQQNVNNRLGGSHVSLQRASDMTKPKTRDHLKNSEPLIVITIGVDMDEIGSPPGGV